jgi:hypothetical protein
LTNSDASIPFFQMTNKMCEEKISKIETLVQQDIGKRGITYLCLEGELAKAAKSLLNTQHVLITTGFFIFQAGIGENDGPMGAACMAKTLLKLDKYVTLLTDKWNAFVVQKAIEANGILNEKESKKYNFVLFPDRDEDAFIQTLLNETQPKFDHFISIERPCAAPDGKYYNMKFATFSSPPLIVATAYFSFKRGIDISQYVAKVDKLFDLVNKTPALNITTIGIGDGGNEIGMGKVRERVIRHVPHGSTIGAVVPTDYLLTCGVSNWGGYAVSAALTLLHLQNLQNSLRGAFDKKEICSQLLPSPKNEIAVLNALCDIGCVDGCTHKAEQSVDGIPFPVHLDLLSKIIDIVLN